MAVTRIPYKSAELATQMGVAYNGILAEPIWPATAPTLVEVGDAKAALVAIDDAITSLEAQLAVARQARQTAITAGRAVMTTIDDVTSALYGRSDARKNNFGLPPFEAAGGSGGGAPPPPVGPLITRIADGGASSSILIDWDTTEGAASYEIEWFTSSALTPATRVGNATSIKTIYTTGTLTPGQQYWFRIRALRPAGPSPWSDPATRVAGL